MSLPAVLTERTLSFTEAAAACPTVAGRKPGLRTVYAWCDTGVLVGGRRLKLESARVGGRRVTSAEALERFLAAVSAGAEPAPVPVSPAARQRESEKAVERLKAKWAAVGRGAKR